jgi:hypothetical protein
MYIYICTIWYYYYTIMHRSLTVTPRLQITLVSYHDQTTVIKTLLFGKTDDKIGY